MTTKIHGLVDGLGLLARWRVTPGQVHDITQADPLIDGIPTQAVVADKAYDAESFVAAIHAQGAEAVIPVRRNRNTPRQWDRHHYKDRNLVERLFCRIKHFRRIATRYDKLDTRFNAFIAVVATFLWLI